MDDIHEKLEILWKSYSDIFNNYDKSIEDQQETDMDAILAEIRLLEGKRNNL